MNNNIISKKQPNLIDTITEYTVEKINKSTGTVLELRSGIFAPIGKISSRSIIHKDFIEPNKKTGKPANMRRFDFQSGAFKGTIEIQNVILTQIHRALLEAILSGKTSISKKDGEIELVCTLKSVQEYYSGTLNLKWFKEKLTEMKTSSINIIANDEEKIIDSSNLNFSVISTYSYSAASKEFTISLNNKYSKIFDNDITINYGKFVKEINSIDSYFVQAVIRFFITQNECEYLLDTIIRITGYGSTDRARRTAIEELNKYNTKLLSFNIVWDSKKKKFSYERNKNIYIYHPTKQEIGEKIDKINKDSIIDTEVNHDHNYQLIAKKYDILDNDFNLQYEKFKDYNNFDIKKITISNWEKWCIQSQNYNKSKKSKTIKKEEVRNDDILEFKAPLKGEKYPRQFAVAKDYYDAEFVSEQIIDILMNFGIDVYSTDINDINEIGKQKCKNPRTGNLKTLYYFKNENIDLKKFKNILEDSYTESNDDIEDADIIIDVELTTTYSQEEFDNLVKKSNANKLRVKEQTKKSWDEFYRDGVSPSPKTHHFVEAINPSDSNHKEILLIKISN